jgi:hypothetical protein
MQKAITILGTVARYRTAPQRGAPVCDGSGSPSKKDAVAL